MNCRAWIWTAVLTASATAAWAGNFGKVVAIGGHAADLALDEGRGVLYVANFTANRVDVMSLADNSVRTSINVPSQPSSLALSPDGGYLLVAHYGNYAAPQSSLNALTVINLNSGNAKRTFALGSPPLGVAFGIDGKALVATSTDVLLFDPVTGTGVLLDTIQGLTAKTLPQPVPAPPTTITAASMAASRDGLSIFAITDTIRIGYDVNTQQLYVGGYISQPPMGPRTISVSDDGSTFAAGWALFTGRSNDASIMTIRSQFPNPTGDLDIGSQAIDSSRGVIYAQIPDATATSSTPILQVVDADNLAVIQRYKLAENLSGKSVLSSDYNTLYSISDSGVTVFPIGSMLQAPTITTSVEDVLFRGSFCDRKVTTQQILITDASGGNVDFTLTPSDTGVRVSPSRGTTPARVTVSVDPNAYQNQTGTTAATIAITSSKAVNLPSPVRVLINTRNPDQVGDIYSVPGTLVDLIADPARERIYVIRQDKNQVLVFDTNTYTQIASLKTGNTPTSLAITFDRRYLLVGSDNSQLLYVYDLDTLEAQYPIQMPFGHYPRSVAASANAILAASRVAGAVNTIDRVDLYSRTATALPSLGVYANSIALGTSLTASPNGSSILVVEPDGTTMLYSANADTFTVGRKASTALAGAYAASSYDQFVAGSNYLNSSLVPMQTLDSGNGASSGFVFVDQDGLYVTAPSANSAGVLERVSGDSSTGIHPTRTVEAPVLPNTSLPFTRTLAAPYTRTSIIILSTSGFTVVPWNFDTAVAPPQIEQIVNAADFSQPVAPGGLISLFGSNLSPVTESSQQTPLPTILGNSCLTVNGQPVPMIYVSSSQINAQLPNAAAGNTTVVLRTPGGVSDNYNLTISAAAPSIFRAQLPGMSTATPVVIRADNNQMVTPSNPVHRGDTLVIYATGLGLTTPAVDPGSPAPYDPLATLVIQPSVTLGGVPLQIDFAGLTPGYVGVYQINVEVKNKVTPGWTVPLVIDQGSGVTSIDVRVVQ
jgi:uncharacterized protein (TIGR03437 family)